MRKLRGNFTGLAVLLLATTAFFPVVQDTSALLIDDFTNGDGLSALGTEWELNLDRVMGGNSSGEMTFDIIDSRPCLHLTGNVLPGRRGGFIQAALDLRGEKNYIDGSAFKGIRLLVRGNSEVYHVHLRTSKSALPWQNYAVEFQSTQEWQSFEIPFDLFTPERLRAEFSPEKLKQVAIVARDKEFSADIAVARIELYR